MYELDMFELYDIASGCDKQRLPYSAGRLAVTTTDDEIEGYSTESAQININATGGCVVVTVDYPLTMTKIFEGTKTMVENYLKGLQDETDDDKFFTFIVMPYLLEGKINILFRDLCFCDSYTTGVGKRLILAFDNDATCIYEDEDTNFKEVVVEMMAELRRREEEIDLELIELDEEEKKLNSQKYLHGINDLNNIDNIINTEETNEVHKFNGNPNVRSSTED